MTDFLSPGVSRIYVGAAEDVMSLQVTVDRLQRVGWIQSLAPWEVMATFTFRWEASLFSAQRCFEKWMRRKHPRLSCYYAIEANPSRDGYHVHSLWADCKSTFRKEAWADWFKRYGRAQIEPVRSARDVSDYASKYLTKDDSWWDCKLQWHRVTALHDSTFKLHENP
jgi:hypothetical protein